ncbi:aberrant root formation protein 4 [Oryza brachyantha]|uniref:aberrant root formation protein 4 n=1 Tax=Oryza brachyantha TaxID=4533 RepID=UPI001ADBAF06|nr:aberrant root formation protein 4 [Oryza brachyantha]
MDAGDTAAVAQAPARLREALAALTQAFESGDCSDGSSAAAVSDLLNAAAAGAEEAGADDAAAAAGVAEEMLREVHAFFSPPSSNQLAIDALSLELVKPVAKLGALMENCCDIARAIIEFFVSNCNPRDMLSILCEAVDEPVASNGLVYFVLLFKELAKVLVLIHRRHTEQVKVALPAVLQVMNAAIPEYDEEHGKIIIDMFNAALGIGNAIQEMCKKMVNQKNEELCSVLSLYSLQNISLISRCKQQHILSACGSVVLQHSKILTFCGFTYFGLLTGNDVTSATDKLLKDEDADLLKCFSFAMDGASLAVIWTYMDDLISKYAEAELESALKDVKGNHTRMWQAINILRYVFSSTHYPWVLKSNGLDLLLSIANESCIEEINDHVDASSSGPEIFATLKAIESVMISAPDALMRKKAFAALKQVVSMVPSSQRFDILQALVQNSIFPSLTAILLDLVKDEVLRESRQADQNFIESDQLQDGREWPPPWFCHALELVGLILKPPEGGPPCLPDHGEQVLSALNLLRFVLIIDSRGSRSRKMFDKETMRKVYSEWLIPLRPIVAGIQSESEEDGSDAANHIMCSLNPVQLVLYRCIELSEEKMKGF